MEAVHRALSQLGVVAWIGTTSRQHMDEDLAIVGFGLTPPELAAIEALFR